MTSDGVNGTAADGRVGAEPPGPLFIKRDDGRVAPRYIEPAYPHAPAGGVTPNLRCERQVAFALRDRTDFMFASLICAAAYGAAPRRAREPGSPAKGLR